MGPKKIDSFQETSREEHIGRESKGVSGLRKGGTESSSRGRAGAEIEKKRPGFKAKGVFGLGIEGPVRAQ